MSDPTRPTPLDPIPLPHSTFPWGIEVFHRTLKGGCRLKDRQLGTAQRLQACLGVDMVVAWRLYPLTPLGREVPEHPGTTFFEEVE